MVGAEWRKASRLYEDLREKVKAGENPTNEYVASVLMKAWDELPPDFRAKIEKCFWDKQYKQVHDASIADLKAEQQRYESRIADYKAAEKAYMVESEKLSLERQKFANAQTFIRIGEAMCKFFKESGIASNARWYDGIGA